MSDDAPERIFCRVHKKPPGRRSNFGPDKLMVVQHKDIGDVEYIRADLLAAKDARIAELEAKIAEFIHGEKVGPND